MLSNHSQVSVQIVQDLAKELLEMFTANKMAKVFFTNSGSETNDTQVVLLSYTLIYSFYLKFRITLCRSEMEVCISFILVK